MLQFLIKYLCGRCTVSQATPGRCPICGVPLTKVDI